jgi:hypothetical protein
LTGNVASPGENLRLMVSTISNDYLALQKELHRNPQYGTASLSFAPIVRRIIAIYHVHSISDYGAGKKNLELGLRRLGLTNFEYFPFDPAFPEYGDAKPADLVCCIDVLEHIEPAFVNAVLDDLRSITVKRGFFSVQVGPAMKHLPDGRNAHLIQQPSSWWLSQLSQYFKVTRVEKVPHGFWVLTEPLSDTVTDEPSTHGASLRC